MFVCIVVLKTELGRPLPAFYWDGKMSVNSSSECRMSVRSGTFFCWLAALETLALRERRSKESRRIWTFLCFYWQKSKLCLLVWSLKQMWFSPLFHGGLTYLSLIVILSPTLQIQMTDVLGLPKTPVEDRCNFLRISGSPSFVLPQSKHIFCNFLLAWAQCLVIIKRPYRTTIALKCSS